MKTDWEEIENWLENHPGTVILAILVVLFLSGFLENM